MLRLILNKNVNLTEIKHKLHASNFLDYNQHIYCVQDTDSIYKYSGEADNVGGVNKSQESKNTRPTV